MSPRFLCTLASSLALCGCTCDSLTKPDAEMLDAGPGQFDSGHMSTDAGIIRCQADLSIYVTGTSGTSSLKRIVSENDFIGGPTAQARVGDYRFDNEKVRLVVQGLGRSFSPQPYGGTILDADLVRPAPNLGVDQFGEIGLLYNFGRTLKPEHFEIIADGSDGQAAILAVTGFDAANDYLSIRNKLTEVLGRATVADPYAAVSLLVTNYFILNPGEQRLRFLTALCNTSNETLQLSVGDLADPGYSLEHFNSVSCTNGYGYGGLCFGLDRMSWFGYQGDRVAYGYAPYVPGQPTRPGPQNAMLTVAGITGTVLGANGISGLVAWINPAEIPRAGELRLGAFQSGIFARDFWVAATLGDISNLIERSRAIGLGTTLAEVTGTVRSNGTPIGGARVALEGANDARYTFTTNSHGQFSATVPVQSYTASAWAPGSNPSAKQTLQISGAGPFTLEFELVAPRRLIVTTRLVNSTSSLPAKVTVLCSNGPCAVPGRALVLYTDVPKDPRPENVALVGYVGANGVSAFELPPAQYFVLVSHGPEYSIFPNDYPSVPGVAIDLRNTDQHVDAVLAHVVDTSNWVSADLHVHAVNSPDSTVDNATRALTFAAEGVDVIVATDHDFVTDYAPVIAQTGLSAFVTSIIGEEISPMEFGHYNIFPLTVDEASLTGGAIDWAGGEGSTLALPELFTAASARGATTVQFNHPRGALGGLTYLKVDTDTFASRTDPVSLGMAPQEGASANDTKLMSSGFNAFELLSPPDDSLNGSSDSAHGRFNDWFTMLSRGVLVAGTGVSDTHQRSLATGWRTWVEVGTDVPAEVVPAVFSARLNALRAIASNGLFIQMKAYRVDSNGAMVTTPVSIGATLAPDPRELGVQVEVQAAEYLDVTRIELYLHRSQDDLRCPIDQTSPRFTTTRVACNGVMNINWPASGIAAAQTVSLTPGDLETAASEAGVVYRRYRKTVSFRLPAPSTDNWVVAMVYGSKSLAPNLYAPPGLSGASSATTPFAVTNPIFIDADGSGYDKPPFAPLAAGPQKPMPRLVAPSTEEPDIFGRWGELFGHD